ncbi:helix-turn-helix transcriptional regulator [Lactobacillus sp. A27]|uniref:helix-turn-helix transcriptional regulator n=1 Tax=Lactobacillus sp. A27 TaxID=2796363 RepID=UPI00191F0B12|nr:helix-turn-helix transcriptional regulator [Lactobacillus sp. A27]MBL1059482.1 helix-turn-helix transcriptional regulator [Lactobacillus sp. A27]
MKNRIKELRLKAGLKQEQLAVEVKITQQTISQYETGQRNPKLETWQKLADYFNVPVAYLKGYTVYTCTRCGGYFIPEPNAIREDIECCPYCMNPYFKGDVLQTFDPD